MKKLKRMFAERETVVDKDAWIRQHVPGLTFADIGGLWGTVNEKVTVAIQAGASSATMIDFQPLGSKWWKAFDERCQSMQITGYKSVEGDICLPEAAATLGRFDMVHCSGILYHVPDVFNFLKNLHQVSNRFLILTSMVIPDVVENDLGRVSVPSGGMLSVPALSAHDKAILAKHFDDLDVTIKGINADSPEFIAADGRLRTGPWWWLFSPETMRNIVSILPFEVLDAGFSWRKKSYSLLLRAKH